MVAVIERRGKKCSMIPVLISFLLISIVATLFMAGARHMFEYKRSVQPGMEIDADRLHFFVRDFLYRQILRLTTHVAAPSEGISSFYVDVDEKLLDALDSNLPHSGRLMEVNARVRVDDPPFAGNASIRYRGGLALHWLYDKKSLRIKLPPYSTYLGYRQFDLVNPSMIYTVIDWISYDLARGLGLLTPDYFPARLYLNGETNGLHFFLGRVDESLLRKNHRMPGSIYTGDTLYQRSLFGNDVGRPGGAVYKNDEGISLIWKNASLWDKDAARNAQMKHDRTDIEKFLEISNLTDRVDFYREFHRYFDKKKYYEFWALDTVFGGYHHDLFHNHKLYFDPYKGKFEPIAWDFRFWSNEFLFKDLPVYPLLRQVLLNPVLEYQRDKVAFDLLQDLTEEKITRMVEERGRFLRKEVSSDPFRQTPDSRVVLFDVDKVVPYSMADYDAAIRRLKLIYAGRRAFLEKLYASVQASYVLTPLEGAENEYLLEISVSGNTPLRFVPEMGLKKLYPEGGFELFRKTDEGEIPVPLEGEEMLYPGRAMSPGNVLGRADPWSILAFGNEKPVPAPLNYLYVVKGSSPRLETRPPLLANNVLTGKEVHVMPGDKPMDDASTDSVHPWKLPDLAPRKTLVLSGLQEITEDRVFEEGTEVIIRPGTRFRMKEGVSLVFYGRVEARGTPDAPIVFEALEEGKPWGSLVVQGEASSGSVFEYVRIAGGSVTTQHLIHYPGQFNIHDTRDFIVSHCVIGHNYVGDDAMHVAYSQGRIENCRFENSLFDALDVDISKVQVSNSFFFNSGNDALDFMTSVVNVSGVDVDRTGDKGISAGEDSEIHVEDMRLSHCQLGIAVKDESRVNLERVYFLEGNRQGIALYRKNPRYSQGGTVSGRGVFGLEKTDIKVDSASVFDIPDTELKPLVSGETSGQYHE